MLVGDEILFLNRKIIKTIAQIHQSHKDPALF